MFWPDRRNGFDRRVRSWVDPLRNQSALLLGVLLILNALNVLDWRLTQLALERGAVEGNPIMSELFGLSTWAAASFKIAILAVVSLAVWRSRTHRRMLEFVVVATALYALLIVYHIFGITFVLPVTHS